MGKTPMLMLPVQSAPVNRTLGAAALTGGNGVEPSFGWDDIVSFAKSAAPYVAQAAALLA